MHSTSCARGAPAGRFVVHQATRTGLATCWIGPGADHASILRHLGDRFDPEHDHIICVCAVGSASRFLPLPIRLISRIQRRRLPLTALFFADVTQRERRARAASIRCQLGE